MLMENVIDYISFIASLDVEINFIEYLRDTKRIFYEL